VSRQEVNPLVKRQSHCATGLVVAAKADPVVDATTNASAAKAFLLKTILVTP
jgi:hypothetical protein